MRILNLFKRKLKLHRMKSSIIEHIEFEGMTRFYIKSLRDIVREESKIDSQLAKETKLFEKFSNSKVLRKQLRNLNMTTKKQYAALLHINLLVMRKVSFNVFKKLCVKEVEQSKFFAKLIEDQCKDLENFEDYRKDFEEEKKLFLKYQKGLANLVRSAGDTKKVKENAKELIKIHKHIQKTKLYEFMKDDYLKIDKKVRYVMKNPKDNKVLYVLTSIYLVSPATFELTFIYLILRYSAKYTKHQVSRIGGKRRRGTSPN